jgi:hypothetical protein
MLPYTFVYFAFLDQYFDVEEFGTHPIQDSAWIDSFALGVPQQFNYYYNLNEAVLKDSMFSSSLNVKNETFSTVTLGQKIIVDAAYLRGMN